MKPLFFLFFTLFTSAVYAEEDYSGVWKDDQGQFYSIHQNGSMIMMAELSTREEEISPFVQGSMKFTDNPFDLAVSGAGFFVIESESGEHSYTRKGNFKLGAGGMLVNERGEKLLTEKGDRVPDNTVEIVIEDTGIMKARIPSDELVEFDRIKLALISRWNMKSFWEQQLVVRDEAEVIYLFPSEEQAGIIKSGALEIKSYTAQEWQGYTGELVDNQVVIRSLSTHGVRSKEVEFHSRAFATIKIEGCSYLDLGSVIPLNILCMESASETPLIKIF